MILNGFIGGSYQSASPLADNEITFNWFPDPIESNDSVIRLCLNPTPGVKVLSTTAFTPGRAHFVQGTREFAVLGTQFGEIDFGGTFTPKGTVAIGGNPATISSNGNAGGQLMITSGGNVYIFNFLTGAFSAVTALNGLGDMGDALDGYFLILDTDTSTVYFSNLNDGLTWQTGTNFFKRSIAADPWVSMKVANRYIWLFGSETSEVWYDAGYFPIPFAPNPSSSIQYGCAAPFSPVVANGSLVWVGKTKNGQNVILQSQGFTPNVISTYAMSNVLSSYTNTGDAIGDAYTAKGHTFYQLNFIKDNSTLCWDSNTQLWHNRGTWVSAINSYVAWRPRFHAFAFGQNRMLDGTTGAIYNMSDAYTTDVDGLNIRRLRQHPPLFKENERLFVNSFELDMEPGLGNTVDPGSNPQVMMSMSNDGGKTFGLEKFRSGGKIGEYFARVRWDRCGQGRRRIFRVSVTDSIQWRLMAAYVNMRPGSTVSTQQQPQAG